MTEPSQYFKGRTVQEQMNEVIGYVDVRSAEVATDAIAADVAQVHQDMLDADADATAAAASAAAAAGTLANAVKKTGEASQSIAGDIAVSGDLTGGTVTVPTPVNNTDAASKKYVDDQDALKISIADINSYAVGLTGNQSVSGNKTHSGEVRCVKSGLPHFVAGQVMSAAPPASNVSTTIISIQPYVDGVASLQSANLNATFYPNGAVELWANVMGADGNLHKVSLADGRNFT